LKELKLVSLARQHRNVVVVIFYFLYAVTLDYGLRFVGRVYDYEGFVYLSDPVRVPFSYLLVIISAYVSGRSILDRVSNFFCTGLFCLLIVPGIVYFMRSDIEYWKLFLLVGGYLWLLISCHVVRKCVFKIKGIGSSRPALYALILIVTTATYGLAIYYLGFKINLGISEVYEVRDHFLRNKNFLLGYLMGWQGNIINPLLFYFAIQKRHILLAGVVVGLQAYLFSITGEKLFLFSLVFSYFVARFSKRFDLIFPILLSAIIILSCLVYRYTEYVWFLALFVERTLFIPAQITFQYIDFFHNNPFVYLSNSVLRYFFNYPYFLSPPLMIGIRYYDGGSANTGIFGNAYMNFGIVGIVVFIGLFSFILSLFDRMEASKPMESPLILASVAMPLFSIVNSGLLTVLLTHGMLLALLIAYLIPEGEV
jgi:hypothetical protein